MPSQQMWCLPEGAHGGVHVSYGKLFAIWQSIDSLNIAMRWVLVVKQALATSPPRFELNAVLHILSVHCCCRAYASMAEVENQMHARFTAYDQYELGVPLSSVGDCMDKVCTPAC
jgi:hypothetical protein